MFVFSVGADGTAEPIFGSPFSVVASAGQANPTKTTAIGEGIRKAERATPTTFIVQVWVVS